VINMANSGTPQGREARDWLISLALLAMPESGLPRASSPTHLGVSFPQALKEFWMEERPRELIRDRRDQRLQVIAGERPQLAEWLRVFKMPDGFDENETGHRPQTPYHTSLPTERPRGERVLRVVLEDARGSGNTPPSPPTSPLASGTLASATSSQGTSSAPAQAGATAPDVQTTPGEKSGSDPPQAIQPPITGEAGGEAKGVGAPSSGPETTPVPTPPGGSGAPTEPQPSGGAAPDPTGAKNADASAAPTPPAAKKRSRGGQEPTERDHS
jgi:hypothetical protein